MGDGKPLFCGKYLVRWKIRATFAHANKADTTQVIGDTDGFDGKDFSLNTKRRPKFFQYFFVTLKISDRDKERALSYSFPTPLK